MKILLLFLAMPLIEVATFVKVGGMIGAPWTIILTVGTAFLGAFLVKTQGIRTLLSVKEQLAQGQMPAAAMVEGIILLVCGALLLTPGFVSDTVGFLGLIPVVRAAIAKKIVTNVIKTNLGAHSPFQQNTFTGSATVESANKNSDGTTIEGQFTRDK